MFVRHDAPHPLPVARMTPPSIRDMRSLSARLVVVLFLSVATLGGWGGRVMGLKAECRHEPTESSSVAAHANGPMAAMNAGDGADDGASGDASCCPSDVPEAPTPPCADHHGALPCSGAQLCAAASALRASITLVAGLTVQVRAVSSAAPLIRIAGPVFAPAVPPPRGGSPFQS